MSDVAGIEVPIVWRGRRARAFVPTLLSDRDLTIDVATTTRTVRAHSEIEHAAEYLPEDLQGMARLLLRSEGVASSYIEGIVAPVIDVVVAEQNASGGNNRSPGAWVAANLAAVTQALETSHDQLLDVATLCRWHQTLMAGSPVPQHYIGVIRSEQGWIGGTSPFDAHLVTPPPETLELLVDDLIAFVNRNDIDPIAQAAIGHAQFEVIHPFADGNGRVGRILVAWILTRRIGLITPPPVSAAIAADVGGYSAGLTLYRFGQLDHWVKWFADAVALAARRQLTLVADVRKIRQSWLEQLGAARVDGKRRLRAGATAWRVLEILPRLLVLTSDRVATELGVSHKTAFLALRELVAAGIVIPVDPAHGTGRPPHTYTSIDLLGLAGSTPLRA